MMGIRNGGSLRDCGCCGMYHGRYETVLDAKSRITVPRKLRKVMVENDHITWHVTRGYDTNLYLYHKAAWGDLVEWIDSLPARDPRVHDFMRLVFGCAAEVRMDGQGRVPIPQHLRDLAGLKKDVVLAGMGGRLELWDRGAWDMHEQTNGPKFRSMTSEFLGSSELGASNAKGETGDEC